ncbi:MAG: beta-ketoacyl-[acyl-carrier-protein] synthase family protein [Holophaga sp.]|nr:beta-ketoacyl-[acyl-carrier-protein] synthase family protein [Holophaga sp.]
MIHAAVPITGLGCISAAGPSLEAGMASMFRGGRDPRPPRRFSTGHPVPYPVFELPEFREPPSVLRTGALLLHAAREALADAGLDPERLATLRAGACIGTTVGSAMNDEGFCRALRAGENPSLAPMDRILRSNPAALLAREFGLSGPCQTVVNACSSGTDAVGLGASWIEAGLCDLVLAGGADQLSRITCDGFIAMRIAAPGPCRPFDRERDGLNLGEGAAVLVLEAPGLRRARARAFVLGYGSACDAHHPTAPSPGGTGLGRAIREAMAAGGIAPAQLAFVNAHGTATPDNDRVESGVLATLLPRVPFLSTKGYTGHTLGAAGAIEAAFTVACLEQGRVPACAGFGAADPGLPAPVAENSPVRGAVALSQSLAFGGNNAVLALGLRP